MKQMLFDNMPPKLNLLNQIDIKITIVKFDHVRVDCDINDNTIFT